MALEYDVAMVFYGGDPLSEDAWNEYIEKQRVLLQAYADEGWELESTVSVPIAPESGSLLVILFYFSIRRPD